MQLIIGGAFSGKRNIVQGMTQASSWISAYNGEALSTWQDNWRPHTTLVLEGWETWLKDELSEQQTEDLRARYQSFFLQLKAAEQKRSEEIILIMLEVGRGLVPLNKKERQLRDYLGWAAQDAAALADEVHYVWNGLARKLK
ncbi:bifunctional adenosylcobinamide kinase/adenosylcobinamide-phosphate guanylyltransferase [Salsuginibacillus kocurii]|uniref:bifunctional adenosylcobinamide kinase/adenosylcobinamide-phosphate guanylyltransferase n=1 Tax=Salsuginibacillus kocurii TaxID=427078 RepID=UPI0003764B99|nr:bifunctional adenosylcobinamide kinase/adenosylcobinamide-phosphate guanylyltransferase [Salsuginibacillus kocurii]